MKPLKALIILAFAASMTSCASIVTRSVYPVDFNSEPQGADLTVENRDGMTVFKGRTPTTVWLEASAGYMRPERYKVTYRQEGREPVTTWIHAEIDGWYFGNLLLGGFVGMLLVDPLTGAMWRIPSGSEFVNVSIEPPYRAPVTHVAPVAPVPPAAPVAAPAPDAVAAPAPAALPPAAPASDEWAPLGD